MGHKQSRVLSSVSFCNEIQEKPVKYDFYTIHASLFGKNGHYMCSKEEVLKEIKKFVEETEKR